MKLKEEYKKQEKRKKIKRTNNLTQQIYLDEIVCRIITKGTSLMKKTKFIFLCHLFLCLGLFVVHDSKAAEDPALVKDINIGSGGSDPFGGERIGSTVYFRADDGINGVELWRSDGTESGTQLVRDICPGSCNSTPQLLTEMNGILYFQAYDGVDSWGLWKSDGTEAGTQLVEDINPSGDENVGSITVVNGYLFFTATDGAHGIELWRSDGTSEGTEMVKDGNSGSGNTSFWMNAFAGSDSHLFFAADTSGGATGAELWISDGTEGGTVMVKDIYPGINGSSPDVFFVTEDGELYFRANDGVNGAELWKSDGTESGTVLVKDVYSGSIGSNPWYMTSVGGWIYFVANDGENGAELWMSDGTDIGTQMVRDINVGGSSNPEYFTAFNGSLYFSANDGSSGCELWKSDGTEAGTTMVKDIRSGSESSWPYEKNEVGGFLYFSSNDGVNGEELWKTDGTESGTSLVYDINSGSGDSVPNIIASTGGTFFMQADNGVSGNELWKVVFAVEPTVNSVAASNIGPFSAVGNGYIEDTGGENPERFIQWGVSSGTYTNICTAGEGGTGSFSCDMTDLSSDTTYYARAYATNGIGTAYGSEISFNTDGISEQSDLGGELSLVKDIRPGYGGSYPYYLANMDDKLYFVGNDNENGYELWVSDGTAAGTQMVKNINLDGDASIEFVVESEGLLYFRANDGTNGLELWKSDGTESGTVMVKDIYSGDIGSIPTNITSAEGGVYFIAEDEVHGAELWKSDGTEEGTTMVKDIYAGYHPSYPDNFFVVGNTLYFIANDGVNGYELWKSDGTEIGTAMVKNINPGGSSGALNFLKHESELYFSADDGVHGYELWKTDGTESGTELVKDINAGSADSYAENLFEFNGLVYFSADDGVHGYELWKTDGTESGTELVKDINDEGNSDPNGFVEFKGFLYFSAIDDEHGSELWKSDGNSENTRMIYDLNPDYENGFEGFFVEGGGPVVSGENLYFLGNDGYYGSELWKADGNTEISEPEINTLDISNIGSTSATGNGQIASTGGEDPERFIQWGTQTGIYTQNCNADTGGAGDYFCNLTGLIPDTTYYVRAYATNSAGTAYGNEITFITTSSGSFIPPAPQIKDIKEKTKNAIKLEIQVDSAYAEQELDFEIRIKNKDKDETDIKNKTEEADEEGKIILTINNFDSDTDYSISVRFSIKDQNNYSDYSDSKKIKTEKDIADDEECRIENLKAKKASQIVTLTWSKACKEINGILVERKNDNNEFKQVASLDDKDISYQDKDEKTGSEYTYRVRGYAGNKYTEYSREVSVLFDLQINQSEGDDQKQVSQTVSEADQGQYYQEQNINKEETKIINPVINTNPKRHGKEAVFFRVLAKTKEIIQEFTEEFTAVTLIGFAAGTAVAASSAAVPFLPASPEPIAQRIFAIAGMLFNRKKKGDDWGTVFDSETKQPIQGAVISLIDQTGHVVDTSISDSQGRYGFLPNPGTYTIHVFKDKHEIQTDRAEDSLYGKVYNGCTLSILQDQIENINISLKNTQVDWHDFARRKIFSFNSIFSIIKRDFFFVLFYAGALISAGIAFMFPSFFNILIFIIYLILLTYQIFFKKKAFGTITHVQTRKPISFAIVSIHEENEPHRRLKFAVSDVLGRYYLLVENGSYLVKISGNLLGGEKFERLLHAKVEDGIVNLDVGV